MSQDIGTPAALAKAIGVSVRQNLGNGCERQRVKRVHGAVVHDGNA
jgi:RNase P protein component